MALSNVTRSEKHVLDGDCEGMSEGNEEGDGSLDNSAVGEVVDVARVNGAGEVAALGARAVARNTFAIHILKKN